MIVCVAVVGQQVHSPSISPLWSPYLLVLVHPIINLTINVVFDRTTRFTYRASPRPTTPSSSTTSFTALSTSSTSEVIENSDLLHDPFGSASRFSRKIVENLRRNLNHLIENNDFLILSTSIDKIWIIYASQWTIRRNLDRHWMRHFWVCCTRPRITKCECLCGL